MAIVTPLKTAAEQQLVQQYADSKAELPGGPAVRKLREDAFAGFEAKGLPHRRLESWRYTDLRTLLREARPLAGGAAVTAAVKARLAALKLDGLRLVLSTASSRRNSPRSTRSPRASRCSRSPMRWCRSVRT